MLTENTPRRIQRRRIKGWKMPPNTVYVGRRSKWGNPFRWTYYRDRGGYRPDIARRIVTEVFRDCLAGNDEPRNPDYRNRINWIRDHIAELRGKNLACWCPLDQPCHADVLLEIANAD